MKWARGSFQFNLFAVAICTLSSLLASGCYSAHLEFHRKVEGIPPVAANAVYGQADFNSSPRRPISTTHVQSPVALGSKLLVVDQSNNRVLIWNSVPSSLVQKPDVVIGQSDLHGIFINAPNAPGENVNDGGFSNTSKSTGLNAPSNACSDGTKLVVSDTTNNRVLIWNSIPTTSGVGADVVIGQPDMASSAINYDGTVTAKTLRGPTTVLCDSGKLYVADTNNNRILFWNSIPTTSYAAADGVLGQPGFVTALANNGGISASTTYFPQGMVVYSGKFLLMDSNNNRLLYWNTTTPTSLQAADGVMGQAGFGTRTVNTGGLSGHSLNYSKSLNVVGTSLYVSDTGNNRVLIWDSFPAVWTTDANRVLGQPDLVSNTTNNGGISASALSQPNGVSAVGTKLIVADTINNRLLVYNSIPVVSNVASDLTWGQARVNLISINGGIEPATSLNSPFNLMNDGTHIWVADAKHNRLLRWPSSRNPFDGSSPDLILGQTNISKTDSDVNASQFRMASVATDGSRFYISDQTNSRILIYNTYPAVNNAPADAVLGQPDFTSSGSGTTNSTFNQPYHLSVSAGKLLVADTLNNRVLIWNTLPSSNVAADVVLGQPDFVSNTRNNGGVSASSMSVPACVYVFAGKLFVCDRANNRVLVWNTIPTLSNTPADYVIGQSGMTVGGPNANQANVNPAGFRNTLALAYNGKKFFLTDLNNSRILVWNQLPTASGVPSDSVIGQPDSFTSTNNYVGTSQTNLWRPIGLLINGNDLICADYQNDRLMLYSNIDK